MRGIDSAESRDLVTVVYTGVWRRRPYLLLSQTFVLEILRGNCFCVKNCCVFRVMIVRVRGSVTDIGANEGYNVLSN